MVNVLSMACATCGEIVMQPDLARLFKLRVVVARHGEMDRLRWWNTKGQLGRSGALALRRGFPRTYHFAQARSTFAVAAQRCAEIFDPPDSVTLWRLPDTIEEALDDRWEQWLDCAEQWSGFFERVEANANTNLGEVLRDFGLVSSGDVAACSKLRRSSEGRGLPLPKPFASTDTDIAHLALGFAQCEAGAIVVPYARIGSE